MDKLIFTGFNTPKGIKTEMAWIDEEYFNKLMAKGHVRYDGLWISNQQYWKLFFIGLSVLPKGDY